MYNGIVQLADGRQILFGSQQVRSAYPNGHAVSSQQMLLTSSDTFRQQPSLAQPIGGHGVDIPHAAAIDPSGNIWIVGTTDSDDFVLVDPIVSTKIPYRWAGFVMELDPTGNKLLFSTYLGGGISPPSNCACQPYDSEALSIAIDRDGNVFVGGLTDDPNFPITSGPPSRGTDGFGAAFYIAYVVKISPAGKLIFGTSLGTGGSYCQMSGCIGVSMYASIDQIVVDPGGATITVAGTKSPYSAFVSRLTADGAKTLWSIMPKQYNGSAAIADDPAGDVYLFRGYLVWDGRSNPTIPSFSSGGYDLRKLNGADGSTVYSVDLGPANDAAVPAVFVASDGSAYVTGSGTAANSLQPSVPNLGPDFVAHVDAKGSAVDYLYRLPKGVVTSTPILDGKGNIVFASNTGTVVTLPLTNNKFTTPAIVGIGNAASYALNQPYAAGELLSVFGYNLDAAGADMIVDQIVSPASKPAILYRSANQINLQVPLNAGRTSDTPGPSPIAPGLFTTGSEGYAAALNQDGSVNSPSNPAVCGSVVTLFGTGAIWPSGLPSDTAATGAMSLDRVINDFVLIDGVGGHGTIVYLGAAPSLLYGVFQMNVQLPSECYSPLQIQNKANSLSSNKVKLYLK